MVLAILSVDFSFFITKRHTQSNARQPNRMNEALLCSCCNTFSHHSQSVCNLFTFFIFIFFNSKTPFRMFIVRLTDEINKFASWQCLKSTKWVSCLNFRFLFHCTSYLCSFGPVWNDFFSSLHFLLLLYFSSLLFHIDSNDDGSLKFSVQHSSFSCIFVSFFSFFFYFFLIFLSSLLIFCLRLCLFCIWFWFWCKWSENIKEFTQTHALRCVIPLWFRSHSQPTKMKRTNERIYINENCEEVKNHLRTHKYDQSPTIANKN